MKLDKSYEDFFISVGLATSVAIVCISTGKLMTSYIFNYIIAVLIIILSILTLIDCYSNQIKTKKSMTRYLSNNEDLDFKAEFITIKVEPPVDPPYFYDVVPYYRKSFKMVEAAVEDNKYLKVSKSNYVRKSDQQVQKTGSIKSRKDDAHRFTASMKQKKIAENYIEIKKTSSLRRRALINSFSSKRSNPYPVETEL